MPPTHLSNIASAPAAETGHPFVDRRTGLDSERQQAERRQFGSSHAGLSDDGRELALAIDQYKLRHHRRYLTCDELLGVLSDLGYIRARV